MFVRNLIALFAATTFTLLPSFAAPKTSAKNSLGFKLAREFAQEKIKKGEGFIISPISLHLAMAMAYNGMSGRTASAMEKYLAQLGSVSASAITPDQINLEAAELIKALNKNIEIPSHAATKPIYVVGTFNGAWNNINPVKKYNFEPRYLGILKEAFDAEVKGLDFSKASSAQVLNDWAANKTNNLITDIIKPDQLSELIWVLMNATYLEASWSKPMRVLDDRAPKFELVNGKNISVPMLYSAERYSYTSNGDFEVVELPFRGGTASMMIVLPAKDIDMKKWSSSEDGVLTEGTWNRIIHDLATPVERPLIRLTLPKFTLASSAMMVEGSPLTKAMGLDFLFSDSATFLNMDAPGSPKSKVGIIKQDAKIELDENGVKAAAVTLVGGAERASAPPKNVVEMIVNRPFAFSIYDRETETFLFIGVVTNPAAQ